MREWAEVSYVSSLAYEKKDSQPYRYLAIRVRRPQGELWPEGGSIRHFATMLPRSRLSSCLCPSISFPSLRPCVLLATPPQDRPGEGRERQGVAPGLLRPMSPS